MAEDLVGKLVVLKKSSPFGFSAGVGVIDQHSGLLNVTKMTEKTLSGHYASRHDWEARVSRADRSRVYCVVPDRETFEALCRLQEGHVKAFIEDREQRRRDLDYLMSRMLKDREYAAES